MGILDFLTGGGLGAIAGAASGIATKVIDLKLKDKEYAQQLALREFDLKQAAAEAAAQFELHKVDADAQLAIADTQALTASFGADKASYGDSTLGRIVDFMRGVTRPLVTYVATGYVVYSGVTDPTFRGQALFIASMAVSWWFAARPGRIADFKR